jgi:hypothetical protein
MIGSGRTRTRARTRWPRSMREPARVRGSREIEANDAGHLAAVWWARGLDPDRGWVIEECRHVSRPSEQAALAAGERVVRVRVRLMRGAAHGETNAWTLGATWTPEVRRA